MGLYGKGYTRWACELILNRIREGGTITNRELFNSSATRYPNKELDLRLATKYIAMARLNGHKIVEETVVGLADGSLTEEELNRQVQLMVDVGLWPASRKYY